jgi:glycosyl transferase family 25
MRTLLINLARSPGRLVFQQEQFARFGRSFERIEAIDGAGIDEAFYRRMRGTGTRLVSRNEIACTLSHRACWEIAAATGEPVLVLEDDVVLDPAFFDYMDALVRCDLPARSLVNAEIFGGQRKLLLAAPAIGPHGAFAIHRLIRPGGGAAAYLVYPEAAKRLIALANTSLHIADTLINVVRGVDHFQVAPAPAVQRHYTAAYRRVMTERTTINLGEKRPTSLQSFLSAPLTRWRRLAMNASVLQRRLRHMGETTKVLEPSAFIREAMGR